MLQLVYISSAAPLLPGHHVSDIVSLSRTNNARDGLTGFVFFNGRRFLQALEGPDPSVERTFDRITHDGRHRAIVTLGKRPIDEREFGNWAMASLGIGDPDAGRVLEKVDALTSKASPNVRAQFMSFARLCAARSDPCQRALGSTLSASVAGSMRARTTHRAPYC